MKITDDMKTKATFRISSPALSPSTITSMLNIEPDATQSMGANLRGDKRFAIASLNWWHLTSQSPEDQSLEAHLIELLDRLDSKAEILATIRKDAKFDFYCSMFDIDGLHIPASVMTRIAKLDAAFGVSLW